MATDSDPCAAQSLEVVARTKSYGNLALAVAIPLLLAANELGLTTGWGGVLGLLGIALFVQPLIERVLARVRAR